MRSLHRIVRGGLETGKALPDVYQTMARAGVRIRQGKVTMIAGRPGSGKTMLTLNLASKWQVPTLYFSNDSDEMTVASRLISRRINSRTSDEVAKVIDTNRSWASNALEGDEHIQWCFDPSPTLQDIETEVEAFEELYGEYPKLIVVDVLMQVNYAEDNEHSSQGRVIQYLNSLARRTGAAVIVVHHTTEGVEGTPCQPRSAILNKISQLPAVILTVASHGETFYFAPVKNRDGRDDASGGMVFAMYLDAGRCIIEDMEAMNVV